MLRRQCAHDWVALPWSHTIGVCGGRHVDDECTQCLARRCFNQYDDEIGERIVAKDCDYVVYGR